MTTYTEEDIKKAVLAERQACWQIVFDHTPYHNSGLTYAREMGHTIQKEILARSDKE